MNNTDILKIIEEIRAAPMNEQSKRAIYKQKYPKFAESFPKLFDASLSKTFPLTYIKFMLEEKEKLESNLTTVDEADKTVYDKLREDYIDPVISSNNI